MEKETSCINAKAIFEYVKVHNNGDYSALIGNLDPEIDSLDDPVSFLTDPNNWISTAVIVKMYERAKAIFNDDMAPYKIAKFAVESTSLGYIQKILVKALWSYKKAIKQVQKINDKFNRSKKVELIEAKKNSAIIRLHWDSKMKLSRDLCLYNKAIYAYMHTIWGGEPLKLEEKCCYFEDGPYCEYHLQWPLRSKIQGYLSRFFTSRAMLKDMLAEQEKDKEIIEEKYEEVNRLNVELNNKIKQLLAIQETGKAILSVLNLDELLSVIMNLLSNVCKINRAIIMLVNEEDKYLEYIYGVGFDGEAPEEIKNYKVPLRRVSNILARVTNTGWPEYVPKVKSSTLRKENILLTYGDPISVYVVPLITRSKVIGVIATDAVAEEGVPKETRETLEVFAPQIAIAIENARLYSKLQEQMEELKRSYVLLSRAEKFSFLGNLSARLAHEIKNPMTAIGTFLQMLPQKFDDEEFRTNFYNIAMEETTRVNSMITELLDLINTRESYFELNNLHDLIDKMIFLISPQSKAKDIEIVRHFDHSIEKVKMDSEKMKQVILNLLSNAVDFTPQGGRIEISTAKQSMNGGKENIRIEIKDNGIGIDQSMMSKIFDPYFTTKHKSNMHNGTGLGLFITHQNIQDHQGTIEVKSEVNKGTTFILTLPSDPSMRLSAKADRYNS